MDKTLIKTGDVAFCVGKSELSKAILKSTNGKFSHTAQFFWLNEELYVIDAQENGVCPRKFDYWSKLYDYTFEVYRNPNPINEMFWINKAMSYSGVPYDKKGLAIGFAILELLRLTVGVHE